MTTFKTINPYTEEVLKEYSYFDNSRIQETLSSVNETHKVWRKTTLDHRSTLLIELGKLLRTKEEGLATLITQEMGKPIRQSRAEVQKCAGLCNFYAENGASFLKNSTVATDAKNSFITFQPIGAVFGIMPWNFPLWQVFRFAVPTLFAGNAAVLKHSPNTTGCALIIELLFQEAGFTQNLFRTLLADLPQVESIIGSSYIQAVTLTGSTQAGRSVGSLSGKYLKKSVLELGGNDPYLIFEDADLLLAIEKCVEGRLINTGQSCIAAKRFLVVNTHYEAFLEGFKSRVAGKQMGNPMEVSTDLGPLARRDLVENLRNQVNQSVMDGATATQTHFDLGKTGYFHSPIILTQVDEHTTAFREELFGPIASIIRCKNESEMIRLANTSAYGLGSAIFSQDIERATKIAQEDLEAGCCFINDTVRSDSRLPFGGVKESGYGRELAMFGIHEFVNIKTIYQN